MRSRVVLLCSAGAVGLLSALAVAQAPAQLYTGRSDGGTMAFEVSGGQVRGFTFESRCPGLRNGTPVSAAMRIVNDRFSYHNMQFTISGRLLRGGMARGTERDQTGDCDSGSLSWTAQLTGGTFAASSAERTGILKAFGDPAAAAPCLIVLVSATNQDYGTVRFRTRRSCLKWIANGVSVFDRDSRGRWHLAFAGSAYKCPIPRVPRSVQRDLGVCPLGSKPL